LSARPVAGKLGPVASLRTWVFWIRGTLVAAISGHWVANVLFDPDEYTAAGLEFTWVAFVPIGVQTALTLVGVVAIGPLAARLGRRLTRPPASAPRPGRLLAALAAAQLLLFLVYEISERVIQREPFVDGLFASGFTLELALALGSAFLLIAIGSFCVRVIRSLRRPYPTSALPDRIIGIPRDRSPAHAVVVVGGVRAPPSFAA
jgi:hypothetical protein